MRRAGARGRSRERRRRLARSQPAGGWRARAAPRGGRRGRARRLARRAPPERGVADVGPAGAPVHHLQGGGDARRSSRRPRLALGDRSGEPPPRPRAARRLGRRRGRNGDLQGGRAETRRPRRAGDAAAAPAGLRPRPAAAGLGARARDRPARRGAVPARRRGGAVAAARGWAHARDCVPGRRPRRPAAPVRRADARRGGAAMARDLERPVELDGLRSERVGADVLVEARVDRG